MQEGGDKITTFEHTTNCIAKSKLEGETLGISKDQVLGPMDGAASTASLKKLKLAQSSFIGTVSRGSFSGPRRIVTSLFSGYVLLLVVSLYHLMNLESYLSQIPAAMEEVFLSLPIRLRFDRR